MKGSSNFCIFRPLVLLLFSTHERSASFSIQSLIVKPGIRQADSPGQSAHVEHSNCLCITRAVDHVQMDCLAQFPLRMFEINHSVARTSIHLSSLLFPRFISLIIRHFKWLFPNTGVVWWLIHLIHLTIYKRRTIKHKRLGNKRQKNATN